MSVVKFLIVDDAIFMRKILKDIIESHLGYIVVAEASTGREAIELSEIYQPDVITMDITMPEMNGIEALSEIKKVSPHSRVLMVTAMSQQAMVIDAVRQGAKDYIVKPFDAERVLSSIKKVVASAV